MVHTLACSFLADGHEVRVVTNRYPRSLPSREKMDGITISRWHFLQPTSRYLRNRRPDLFLASFYYYPLTLLNLMYLVATFRPDVINLHFPDVQIPFVLWLKTFFPFRLIVSFHGDDVMARHKFNVNDKKNQLTPYEQRRLMQFKKLLGQANGVTACSRYLLDKIVELEPTIVHKSRVIYNGADLDRFQDQTSFEYPRPYILAYGRLTFAKGFDQLIDAFGQVALTYPHVDLIIAGEGEDKPLLSEKIDGLKLKERICLWGRAPSEKIIQFLNACEFLVVPSRMESFGLAALEGMAAGKPILATKVGGLPEIVGMSGNLLVEPTVEGLVSGLYTLLAQKPQWSVIGQSNRLRAEQFTWERVTNRYMEIYQ